MLVKDSACARTHSNRPTAAHPQVAEGGCLPIALCHFTTQHLKLLPYYHVCGGAHAWPTALGHIRNYKTSSSAQVMYAGAIQTPCFLEATTLCKLQPKSTTCLKRSWCYWPGLAAGQYMDYTTQQAWRNSSQPTWSNQSACAQLPRNSDTKTCNCLTTVWQLSRAHATPAQLF